MTIGIAISGPWAGAGILAGLNAVEAIGHGAIGGFVSLAVLTADQKLLRAETQNGGGKSLFTGSAPNEILRAPFAALISSGPNRPSPLSQFVSAAPGIGIVTGHRFPQVKTNQGDALNSLILEAMGRGLSAQKAIDQLIADHPDFDAGFIALSTTGGLGIANMPSVLQLSDHGMATSDCVETGAKVATLHNAIHPHKAIATLANEVALHDIRQRQTKMRNISISAGVELRFGAACEIHVDEFFNTTTVLHPNANNVSEETSFGIGDRVKVVQQGVPVGTLAQEPYMVVRNGIIVSLDGEPESQLAMIVVKGTAQ